MEGVGSELMSGRDGGDSVLNRTLRCPREFWKERRKEGSSSTPIPLGTKRLPYLQGRKLVGAGAYATEILSTLLYSM